MKWPTVFFIAFVASQSPELPAQDEPVGQVVVHAGPGGIGIKPVGGPVILMQGIALAYEAAGWSIMGRYSRGNEFQFVRPSYPEEKFEEGAVLYGFRNDLSNIISSFSVGLGWITGVRRGEFLFTTTAAGSRVGHFGDQLFVDLTMPIGEHYEEVKFVTFGIALGAQYVWKPFTFLALGIEGAANLNVHAPFVGVLGVVQLAFP